MTTKKTPAQLVEEGKKRLEELNNRRTRALTILETERTKLAAAKLEASVEYGVDDLAALRRLYAEQNAANEAKAQEFIAALDEAEAQLKDVEAQLAQAQ